MRHLFASLCLGAVLALPAFAQPAASPEARAEAQRTLEAMNMRATMEQTVTAVRPALIQQLQRSAGGDAARATAAVDEVIMPALREALPQMVAGNAEIWARHYTVAELRQLREFYATPLGRKTLELTPVMAQETMQMVQTLMPRILQETIARNRDALRARGLNL